MKTTRLISIVLLCLMSFAGSSQTLLTLHLPKYPNPDIKMVEFSITNINTGENIQSNDTSFSLKSGKYKVKVLPHDLFDTVISIKNNSVNLDLSQVDRLQNDHLKFYESLSLDTDTVTFAFYSQGCFGGLRKRYFGKFWFKYEKAIELIGFATEFADSSEYTIRADYSEFIQVLFHAAYPQKSWSTLHYYMVLRTRHRFLIVHNSYLEMFSIQKIK